MQHMPDELRERLWKAAIEHSDEIIKAEAPYRSANRSIGFVSCNGLSVALTLDLGLIDGTSKVFHISATEGAGPWHTPGKPQLKVNRWFHNDEDHWEQQITEAGDPAVVIVGHTWYRIGKDVGPLERRGFAGRRFQIRFHDGREVATNDLWFGGPIPPVFRDRLPDNAVFVPDGGGRLLDPDGPEAKAARVVVERQRVDRALFELLRAKNPVTTAGMSDWLDRVAAVVADSRARLDRIGGVS
jgi:hypothetical protein